MKTYLSAERLRAGLGDQFGASVQLPQLEYVLRGIKWVKGKKGGMKRERLPTQLLEVWGDTQDTILIWAALGSSNAVLFSFFFQRAGEMTTMTRTSYDPKVHLCHGDVASMRPIHHGDNPETVKDRLRGKASKARFCS